VHVAAQITLERRAVEAAKLFAESTSDRSSDFGAPHGLKYTSKVASYSGVVQLVAHGPLEPRILVRVQAPEPFSAMA
jgi:hypothetical protein